jgi:CxxC motif-containing protein (DUF1111 family)
VGDGFVEAINDSTLLSIRDNQLAAMRGTAISVPLLEAPWQTRIGCFGWKDSIASLLSFSASAYVNEVGVTSPLQPNENTSLGRNVSIYDTVADPEDTGGDQGFGEDVEAFTRFMRSTKAPARNIALILNDATDPGSALFDSLSCSVCHVRSITTAPVEQWRAVVHLERGDTAPRRAGHFEQDCLSGAGVASEGATHQVPEIAVRRTVAG